MSQLRDRDQIEADLGTLEFHRMNACGVAGEPVSVINGRLAADVGPLLERLDQQAAEIERLRAEHAQDRGWQQTLARDACDEIERLRAELAAAQARAEALANAAKIVLEAPMGTSGRYLVAAEAFDFLRAALAGDAARPLPEATP